KIDDFALVMIRPLIDSSPVTKSRWTFSSSRVALLKTLAEEFGRSNVSTQMPSGVISRRMAPGRGAGFAGSSAVAGTGHSKVVVMLLSFQPKGSTLAAANAKVNQSALALSPFKFLQAR